ncbi:MAG: bifunctional diguanylate cyclase/phosphodiesterase [Proteobacteria bacterium]|nr:bifunctional diguanylate cyclase/phosphodiesterase [Pseudomonadota bacterium]
MDLDMPLQRLRRGYFLALLILALVACGSYLIIDAMQRAQSHAVKLTEIAASQRSNLRRVAQIVELILRTQDQNPGGQRWLAATHQELAALADDISTTRLAFDAELARMHDPLSRPFIRPLISTQRAQRFSAMTEAAAEQTRKFAALDPNQVEWRFSVWAPIELELAAEGALMVEATAIAGELNALAMENSASFRRVHMLLAVVTLLTLLAEYLLIFHPMLEQLRLRHDKLARVTSKLRHLASHDLLTGVGNRLLLRQQLLTMQANEIAPEHAVLLVDIDDFKNVNDIFGHAAGDHILGQIAHRLHARLKRGDALFRTGSDEFTVLIHGELHLSGLVVLANRLCETVSKPMQYEGKEFLVRACVGAAAHSAADPITADELLKRADFALRTAKLKGPGHIRIFDKCDQGLAAARDLLGHRLGEALAQGRIRPCYQPIYDIRSRRIVGVEALARWHTEDGEVLTPTHFLPTLQEYGMLDQLSDAMLRGVARDRQQWLERGLMPDYVSINFSESTLADKRLPQRLQALFGPGDLHWLHVEVVETALLNQGGGLIESNLRHLMRQGVRVALDDFGTGYASLTHLRGFPCSVIKIDQSFVSAMLKDAGTLLIVRGIIDIAVGLGIEVIAEGIETAAQCEVFQPWPQIAGQGYFFSRPLSPEALLSLLAEAAELHTASQRGLS